MFFLGKLLVTVLTVLFYTLQSVAAKVDSCREQPLKPVFNPSGYDKDLVEVLERDIVQQNPNIKW